MTKSSTNAPIRAYLAELDAALADLPSDVRRGILEGVGEELRGLSESDTVRRIQQLGHPAFIASQARAEAGLSESDAADATRELSDPAWFPVVAALLVMVGGVLIPFVGAIAGLVMVWFSRTWTRAEKWVATLTPVVAVVLAVLLAAAAALSSRQDVSPSGDVHNPLVPALFDAVWSSLLMVLVVQVFVGIWLLVRARAR
ncbi:hypothetical protein GY21_19745 [Cryobacterium roopkundense]|uniref:Putative membrane protein n=1 Tax=Cryobacterium roopkundense TaxID=1001240 RepID=A0A099J0V4_9MICO|nr:hypothetical protein [Cryobacterium roopkundense]KGJ71800.1 hypothetical protein GY21_19745 [Cryobacterium roopkundense]MBB5643606.1 putative membrane protein [Cryobacterium roopkundense]